MRFSAYIGYGHTERQCPAVHHTLRIARGKCDRKERMHVRVLGKELVEVDSGSAPTPDRCLVYYLPSQGPELWPILYPSTPHE